MAKVTAFGKDVFKMNRKLMLEENIQWAFCRETGVTIIYKVMPKGNFIKLSVAYCSPQDRFKKKIGLITAMTRWHNDMAIQIPACWPALGNPQDTIQSFADIITFDECNLKFVG